MTEKLSSSIFQTWAALLAVSLGIFAVTLDGSMMPVAIGSIIDDLNTQVAFVQAAMALHSLVMAATYRIPPPMGTRPSSLTPTCQPITIPC
jgi:hypothetical protein